jgi:transketolase
MTDISPLSELTKKTITLRKKTLKAIYCSGSAHLAGSMSAMDLLIVLYFGGILRYDPKNPNWEKKDRFVLSCGHICPALYTVLAEAGYFSAPELNNLRKLGSPFQGHPDKEKLPAIETTAGSLGQGLSVAVGMALAQPKSNVFVLASDGEQQEGQVWEAAMTAAKFKLDNLVLIIDNNRIQIDGKIEKIMPIESLKRKYESFNWQVLDVNGHDLRKLSFVFRRAIETKGQPVVIIANTVAGKGVPFAEGKAEWHQKTLTEKEYQKALTNLRV